MVGLERELELVGGPAEDSGGGHALLPEHVRRVEHELTLSGWFCGRCDACSGRVDRGQDLLEVAVVLGLSPHGVDLVWCGGGVQQGLVVRTAGADRGSDWALDRGGTDGAAACHELGWGDVDLDDRYQEPAGLAVGLGDALLTHLEQEAA